MPRLEDSRILLPRDIFHSILLAAAPAITTPKDRRGRWRRVKRVSCPRVSKFRLTTLLRLRHYVNTLSSEMVARRMGTKTEARYLYF